MWVIDALMHECKNNIQMPSQTWDENRQACVSQSLMPGFQSNSRISCKQIIFKLEKSREASSGKRKSDMSSIFVRAVVELVLRLVIVNNLYS